MAAKKISKFRTFKCGVILFLFTNSCATVFYSEKGCCICQKKYQEGKDLFHYDV